MTQRQELPPRRAGFVGYARLVCLTVPFAAGCSPWLSWFTEDNEFRSCLYARDVAPNEGDGGAERIQIARTDAPGTRSATRRLHGEGADFVGRISVGKGSGYVDMGCDTLPLALYGENSSGGETTHFALAAGRDRIYQLIFTCSGDALADVWYQGTDGTPWTYETTRGRCTQDFVVTDRVTFPDVDLPVPPGLRGYTITGDLLAVSTSGSGTVVFGDVQHQLVLMASNCAPSCESSEVVEALAWDPATSQAVLVTFALRNPGEVELVSTVTLPAFELTVDETVFAAEWTSP